MAKKAEFPRVQSCKSFFDIRVLLAQVRYKSPEYRALMLHWRRLCMDQIWTLAACCPSKLPKNIVEVRRKLYENCPSGSVEETIALNAWQKYMPYHPALAGYRERIFTQASKAFFRW